MRVSHFFEWEDTITGGQKQSVKNQRKIMDRNGIDYTTEPDLSADILHLNIMGPRSVYLAWKAQRKDINVIAHAHQTAEDFRDSFTFSNLFSVLLKPYLKIAYSLPDHIVCPSEYNREVMEKYTDVPKTVISNGFDPEKIQGFEELRQEYLEKYDLEPPVVFNVGHVIKRKGLEEFVETAREMPETDFVWFGFLNPTGGNGFLDSMLQSRDTKKIVENSPENCTFTGYIDDVRGGFAAGDIFFFPSKNENEGMALLESMSAGKPVVVRDIEVYDWLADGEDCLKAEKDFKSCIEELERDEEYREEIGDNAEERSQEFELGRVGEKLVSLYRELA